MSNNKPPSTHNPKAKWHKPKIKTIILAIVCCVALYLVLSPIILRSLLQSQINKESAIARVNNARYNHKAALETLKQILKIDTLPQYSAIYNTCYQYSNDHGWFAYTYYYECELVYIDFFEIPGNSTLLLSHKTQGPTAIFFDQYVKSIGSTAINVPNDYLYVVYPTLNQDGRLLTDSTILAKHVIAYAVEEAYKNRELVSESGSRQLDTHKAYIVLTNEDVYFSKDIGCAPNGIFCNSPLGE